MSDLIIGLANYIAENESTVSFEEAQELVLNMDDGSLAALIEEAQA